MNLHVKHRKRHDDIRNAYQTHRRMFYVDQVLVKRHNIIIVNTDPGTVVQKWEHKVVARTKYQNIRVKRRAIFQHKSFTLEPIDSRDFDVAKWGVIGSVRY